MLSKCMLRRIPLIKLLKCILIIDLLLIWRICQASIYKWVHLVLFVSLPGSDGWQNREHNVPTVGKFWGSTSNDALSSDSLWNKSRGLSIDFSIVRVHFREALISYIKETTSRKTLENWTRATWYLATETHLHNCQSSLKQ